MNKLTLSDVVDEKLVEALRLVQCMLEDFRAQNYGDAHGWIRHIDSAMSDYTDAHTDDAYSILHDLLQSGNSGQVPAGLVSAVNRLLDSDGGRGQLSANQYGDAREEIERLLAATPAASDGWIPVSERMPAYGKYLVLYEFGRPGGPLEHAVARYMKFDKNPPNKEIVSDWVCGVKGAHNITHWQPLPDAPKVKP